MSHDMNNKHIIDTKQGDQTIDYFHWFNRKAATSTPHATTCHTHHITHTTRNKHIKRYNYSSNYYGQINTDRS